VGNKLPLIFKRGLKRVASLSTTQIIIVFLVLILGYGIFSVYMLKDKVYCTFRRKDRVVINKVVNIKSGRVVFSNCWYDLDPRRTTQKIVWMGIIPTWVRCLDFREDSRYPLDPETFNNDADSPSDRAALDMTDDLRALLETQKIAMNQKGSGKKGMLESLMPIIMICGFLIIGYFVYKEQAMVNSIGMQGNVTQSQIQDLQKTIDEMKVSGR
jgi:hypothetical protein